MEGAARKYSTVQEDKVSMCWNCRAAFNEADTGTGKQFTLRTAVTITNLHRQTKFQQLLVTRPI